MCWEKHLGCCGSNSWHLSFWKCLVWQSGSFSILIPFVSKLMAVIDSDFIFALLKRLLVVNRMIWYLWTLFFFVKERWSFVHCALWVGLYSTLLSSATPFTWGLHRASSGTFQCCCLGLYWSSLRTPLVDERYLYYPVNIPVRSMFTVPQVC